MSRGKIQYWALCLGMGFQLQAGACGYHDPVQVQIGALNWMYENSLHVTGAIAKGQQAGTLPTEDLEWVTARGPYREKLEAQAYQKTAVALKQLGVLLASAQGDGFSLVLVETALWSSVPPFGSTQSMKIDAGKPHKGDLVVVTGAPVIFALVNSKLTVSDAVDAGYIKLYGEPEQISGFIEKYGAVGHKKLEKLVAKSADG